MSDNAELNKIQIFYDGENLLHNRKAITTGITVKVNLPGDVVEQSEQGRFSLLAGQSIQLQTKMTEFATSKNFADLGIEKRLQNFKRSAILAIRENLFYLSGIASYPKTSFPH